MTNLIGETQKLTWKYITAAAVSDGLATFRTFLKSEYSDENIEFWLTCEDYKKIKSSFRMSSRAKKIYEQFIKAESPKEVNPRAPCATSRKKNQKNLLRLKENQLVSKFK